MWAWHAQATGEKILVLEDLGAGTVTGDLLGVGHVYTWDKKDQVEAATLAGPGPVAVVAKTFAATVSTSTITTALCTWTHSILACSIELVCDTHLLHARRESKK